MTSMLEMLINLISDVVLSVEERRAKRFLKSIVFSKASNEKDLSYQDPYVTKEQKKRDEEITRLLEAYVRAYEKKMKHSNICRYIIFIPCMLIIVGLTVILGFFSFRIFEGAGELEVSNLVAFVTACVSFVTLIIGLLSIITKYFFPENDEQYITKIVESIQKNDLDNKRENAKYRNGSSEANEDMDETEK